MCRKIRLTCDTRERDNFVKFKKNLDTQMYNVGLDDFLLRKRQKQTRYRVTLFEVYFLTEIDFLKIFSPTYRSHFSDKVVPHPIERFKNGSASSAQLKLPPRF